VTRQTRTTSPIAGTANRYQPIRRVVPRTRRTSATTAATIQTTATTAMPQKLAIHASHRTPGTEMDHRCSSDTAAANTTYATASQRSERGRSGTGGRV
jgi:hypothetical protein